MNFNMYFYSNDESERVKCAHDDAGGVVLGCAVCAAYELYGLEKLHMSYAAHCECV